MIYDPKIYEKNIEALSYSNSFLTNKLKELKENTRFEVMDNNQDSIIIDTQKNLPLESYKQSNEQSKKLEIFKHYSHLFLFGIGNGVYLKYLLEETEPYVFIFEPSLELLFITLHTIDISNYLRKKLFIAHLSDLTHSAYIKILNSTKAKYSTLNFRLILCDPYYYEVFEQEYNETRDAILEKLNYIILNDGTDVNDSLTGLTNHILNLENMLKSPNFQDNIVSKAKTDVGIIVSSGPSLAKQLPFLKEVQDYVTIISADASLTILERNGIKADFCVSMERDEPVKLLFENIPEDYKKDVIFIRASLQMDFIKDYVKPGVDMLVMRPFAYNKAFYLKKYGYICSGMSVANMAHELCAYMGFKQAVFIGQDLAYGKDGQTHSKGHIYGEKASYVVDAHYDKKKVLAYGGVGEVETNEYWNLFRYGLEQTIEDTKSYLESIDATEGGARIKGSIEMPFKEVIEKYVDKSKKKEKFDVVFPTEKEIQNNIENTKKVLSHLIDEGTKLQALMERAVKKIGKHIEATSGMEQKKLLKYFSDKKITKLLDYISKTRRDLDNKAFKDFYYNFVQQTVIYTEMKLTAIRAEIPKNPKENKQKALFWITHHFNYFFEIAGFINATIEVLKQAPILQNDESR